jgi:hypothetical protein
MRSVPQARKNEVDTDTIEAPTSDLAAQLADDWARRAPFDWFVTFTFNEATNRNYRLSTPQALTDFVRREMRRFGYYGPFVIVPHDNGGTRYYHAHVLMVGANGAGSRLSEQFSRYGNVSDPKHDVIRGRGALLYCANRAVNVPQGEEHYEIDFDWHRRPRPRGKRPKSHKAQRPAVETRELT